jgi:hypothetical protein
MPLDADSTEIALAGEAPLPRRRVKLAATDFASTADAKVAHGSAMTNLWLT